MFLKQVFEFINNSHCIMLTKQQQKTSLHVSGRPHHGYKHQMFKRNTKRKTTKVFKCITSESGDDG